MKALIIAIFAFMSVSVLFANATKNQYFMRFGILAIIVFFVSMYTGNIYVAFITYVFISIYVMKKECVNTLYFYIVLLPAFPLSISLSLGLPGIDTLVVFNHHRILILVMLMPLFFKVLSDGGSLLDPLKTYSGLIDRLLLLYIFLEWVSLFRDYELLVACRRSLFLVVDVWLAYFVVSRTVRSINTALAVVLYTAIILAVIGVFEQKLFYRIYDAITLPMGAPYLFVKIRDGQLRSYASMSNPLVLGFFFALAFLLAYRVRDLFLCPKYFPWLLSAVIILGADSTGSRSPVFANIVGVLVLIWWYFGRGFVAKTAKYAFVIFVLLFIVFFSGGAKYLLAFDDDQGTFQYRYDLIFNALHIVTKSPLLGTSPVIYLQDPILLQSLQGEGIIDITNTYLLIALKSGLVSLAAYLGIWFALLKGLYSIPADDKTSALLMAVCMVVMVMLFITSAISFVPAYCWLLIALTSGYIRRWQIGESPR
jgi:hypothetical protein